MCAQVGATPEGVEKPRCLRDASIMAHAASLAPEDRPTLPSEADPKWRFFHRLGDRPAATQYPELNAEPVLPAAFPEWRQVMDGWGGALRGGGCRCLSHPWRLLHSSRGLLPMCCRWERLSSGFLRAGAAGKLLGAVATVAEMAARGFGLEADAFTARMQHAPHLLAPTGALRALPCQAAVSPPNASLACLPCKRFRWLLHPLANRCSPAAPAPGADLDRHGRLGTVVAGFHYDLNVRHAAPPCHCHRRPASPYHAAALCRAWLGSAHFQHVAAGSPAPA